MARFPHIRGDAPDAHRLTSYPLAVPPHTRGCSGRSALAAGPDRGSPTYEGMLPRSTSWAMASVWFPHIRGDAPAPGVASVMETKVPPHTRGCSQGSSGGSAATLGSPTYEGMLPDDGGAERIRRGFPHTRGDLPTEAEAPQSVPEVPPHARGSTLLAAPFFRSPQVPPHARGSTDRGGPPGHLDRGSPHARGSTFSTPPWAHYPGGSPTREGIHPLEIPIDHWVKRFPHTRGDPPLGRYLIKTLQKVPHTRGG